jgi:hypothetical protein
MTRSSVKRLAWMGSIGVIALTVTVALVVSIATGDVGTSVGLSLAGGALLLAAVAAWAATLAYADTLRAPRLTWTLAGPLRDPGSQIQLVDKAPPFHWPKEETVPPEAVLWCYGNDAKQITLQVRITNHGDATARNIFATLTFTGLRVYMFAGIGSDWKPLDTDARWYSSVYVWDAGLDFAIHGADRSRDAPPAALGQFYLTSRDAPSVRVDVVCDGFDSHEPVTITLTGLLFPGA